LFVFFIFYLCARVWNRKGFLFLFQFCLHGLNLSRPYYQFYFYNWSGLGSTSKLF
jgi:hypothetical protein